MKELEQLAELLKLEKQKDFDQFSEMIKSLSMEEKKTKGLTWYPLEVTKSGYTYGERAFVIVEKTGPIEPHQFRSGKTVNLFTKAEGAYNPERTGVINFVEKNRMKIILNSKDLPDWLGFGLIGVDLLFDETTYLEMEKALDLVIKAKNDRLAELRDVLLGKDEARFLPTPNMVIPSLNESQNKAVNQILASQDVAIVHGPPVRGRPPP